jgi:membrane-bound serine protease (ClpP class)
MHQLLYFSTIGCITVNMLLAALALLAGPVHAVVLPIHGEIAQPSLYVLRRGLKRAAEEKAGVVILDINTPGGALDVTLQMMEALGRFPGQTIAFVDDEAMSAGAILSGATDEIWFTPKGVIGAAAPVSATGQDIDATMKEKLVSYLTARIRAMSEGKRYRGVVISAMIDADSELKVDGKTLKDKGSLLSLTASEAMRPFGQPPAPLLGSGIAPTADALLAKKFGPGHYSVETLESTWSESLAVVINELAAVLLGLGLLSLYIAFKTSSFGVFGVAGIALLGLVFFGSAIAGLSGHEPVAVFCVGAVLVALELLFWHSAGFLGAGGAALMIGALLWSMADLWPNEPFHVAWNQDAFARPLANLGIGMAIAIGLGLALIRLVPRGWFLDRLVLGATVSGSAQSSSLAPEEARSLSALLGQRGVAATALHPSGQVEVGGRRYEAKVEVGVIDSGAAVVVRGLSDFGVIVEKAE